MLLSLSRLVRDCILNLMLHTKPLHQTNNNIFKTTNHDKTGDQNKLLLEQVGRQRSVPSANRFPVIASGYVTI